MGICIRMRWRCMVCAVAAIMALSGGAARSAVQADAPVWVSCSAPSDLATAATCAEYAGTILDATVLIRLVSRCADQSGSLKWWHDSHATILDDRTLVSHSHYLILDDASCRLRAIMLYNSAGRIIEILADPALLASIERQLRPRDSSCRGESCTLRFPRPYFTPPTNVRFACPQCEGISAELANLPEVAVINWKGYPGSTYVQWTRPRGLSTRGGVPVLEVTSDIRKGASGGGAWVVTPTGMMHIGNCWRRAVNGARSVVALNPPGMS